MNTIRNLIVIIVIIISTNLLIADDTIYLDADKCQEIIDSVNIVLF